MANPRGTKTSFFSEMTNFVSVVLLILVVLAGAVGSLSVLVMLPFASMYGTNAISAVATGMGELKFYNQFADKFKIHNNLFRINRNTH